MAQNAGAVLAQIRPAAAPPPQGRLLSAREKAAVIVRLLLAEGADVQLNALPDHMQAAVTEQMGQMRLLDRATVTAVVAEFAEELEQVGLSFPGGIEGALSLMDGHISPSAASRLRRLAGDSSKADPWDRIVALPRDQLAALLQSESAEVAAVILSKLPVARAAELLAGMPGERARRVAYAMSLTGGIHPETVRRIGVTLVSQIDSQPARAFDTGPVERVGAILNVAPPATREDVLAALAAEDEGFADSVRKSLFTFVHIPARIAPRDVPKVTRAVDQAVLVTALAAARARPDVAAAVDHVLSNLSQRMAQGLQEEIAARGTVKPRDGDAAMAEVILGIRKLEAAGELALVVEEVDG
jgi:flagellar motor switch protein FliG